MPDRTRPPPEFPDEPSTTTYILDAAGWPVQETDARKWVAWLDANDTTIAYDKIADDVAVHSVFLGLSDGTPGALQLWETLIVGGPLNGQAQRSDTKKAALAAHHDVVKRARAVLKFQE